jgi:hypothetical protein
VSKIIPDKQISIEINSLDYYCHQCTKTVRKQEDITFEQFNFEILLFKIQVKDINKHREMCQVPVKLKFQAVPKE